MGTSERGRATLSPQDLEAITRLAQEYPSVVAMEAAVRDTHNVRRFSVTDVLRLHGAGLITDREARECLGWGKRQPSAWPETAPPRPPAPPQPPPAMRMRRVAPAVGGSPPFPTAAPASVGRWTSHPVDALIRFCWNVIWRFTAVLALVLLIDGGVWLLLTRAEFILATLAVSAIGYLTHAWRRRGLGGALWRTVAAALAVAWGAAGLIASVSAYAIAAGFAVCVIEPAVGLAAARRATP
jgi:hypothetical protein